MIPAPLSASLAAERFERIDTGFLANTLIQDRDGFFWIGGNNGLYKYDGYTFKQYVAGPGGLAGNYVTSLYEDSRGMIWVGSLSGLCMYDKGTDSFTTFLHDPDNPETVGSNHIGDSKQQTIVEDGDRGIWIGTGDGLNRFDPETGTFTRYRELFIDNDIWSICPDGSGAFWVGTARGLHLFDPRKGTVTARFESDDADPLALHGKHLNTLLVDRGGTLWVGTMKGGLNRLEKGQTVFTHYRHVPGDKEGISDNSVLSILEADGGGIWLGTMNGGLNLLNKETGAFEHFTHDPENPNSIGENYIADIYRDHLGVIWFLSYGGILHRRDPGAVKFQSFVHFPGNPRSLSKGNYIAQAVEDRDGIFWIAVGGSGLDRFDRKTGAFTRYTHNPDDPGSLPESHGQSVLEDREGNLWVSTANGIHLFDKTAGKVLRSYPAENWPSSPVQDITNPDLIWYGTWGSGLLRFNRATGETAYIGFSSSAPEAGISDNTIAFVYQDDTGIIWLCTRGGGLDRFDPRTETVTARYRHLPGDDTTIGSNSLNQIFRDKAGRFWVTTDKGIDHFDPETGRFRQYNRHNGFYPLGSAGQIMEDSRGFLWIAGHYSGELVRLDPRSGTSRVYGGDDGILPGIGGSFAALESRDGELWFYGRGGIITFRPETIRDNTFRPRVFLTSLSRGGEAVKTGRAMERVETLGLDWRQNFFEFKAAALSYRHPEHNRYRYKLEGVDHGWFDSGYLRQGRYTGLAPGSYTLKIQGSNNDGVWSDKIAELAVIVSPPWWATPAFRIFAGLLLIGLIFSGIRYRMRGIQEQRQRLEILVDEKTRDLGRRVKELNCQYGISRLVENQNTLEGILQGTADLLPASWPCSEAVCARIGMADGIYTSRDFRETPGFQSQSIVDGGREVGFVEIRYMTERSGPDDAPCREGERELLNAVAQRLGQIIAGKRSEEERKLLEDQLRHSQKMEAVGTMAGGITHNFNNILSAVMGYADMAKLSTPSGSRAHGNMDKVLEATRRAGDLVNRITTFSAAKEAPAPPYDPGTLLLEAMASLESGVYENITVRTHVSPDIAKTRLAPSRFKQVVENLCINALESMGNNRGVLEITLENTRLEQGDLRADLETAPGDYLELTVRDTGQGITRENMPRIYTPFFTTKAIGEGEGIGLSVVHGIVQKHGGRITAESGEGQGAAFHVFLPSTGPAKTIPPDAAPSEG